MKDDFLRKTWKDPGFFLYFSHFLPIFRVEYYVNKFYSSSDPGVVDMPDVEALLPNPTVFSLVPEGLNKNELIRE